MTARVDPAERLLDLVIALANTRRWMTKAEIREKVAGYGDSASPEAFERLFERDKETLRRLGVPLTTSTHAVHGDDIGYRVATGGYALPSVELDPAEIGVLSLAAQVWEDAALGAAARRGLTKLRAVAESSAAEDLGVVLRLAGQGGVETEDRFEVLLAAIDTRQAVSFTYRAASTGETTKRQVEPWRLITRAHAWYLIGGDRDRDAARAFRLSRISGRIRTVGEPGAFTPPESLDLADMFAARSGEQGTARVAILPGRASALRSRSQLVQPAGATGDAPSGPLADRDVLELPFEDAESAAATIAPYGPAVLVLGPERVREAVLRRLRAAAALDRDTAAEWAPVVAPGGEEPGHG
ncbi:helix-turn-helix transcriptional regulator [Bogoriella caseilytica]|uniref:Proteasome accessory factor B n=1 Tax=Bogoriella caseilytica TaxID=56055 RepID=A0A3N2BGL8_9MICO|nr:WYL domain-containing protein [Bogoriella caseilytica]ROR74399.1 proteasome accessory factor B [Bogoriella caseilytica]